MAGARSRVGRRAVPDGAEPYLGAETSFLTPVVGGRLRRFQRPANSPREAGLRQAWNQMQKAEQQLPRLLAEISQTALAADPVMLYSSLHVLDAMRRSSLPGNMTFGSDAMVEFYGGLVTAMPADQVLQRLGADFHPQALFDLDRLLREYARAESLAHQAKVLGEGAADKQASVLHMLQMEQRFDRMQGYPAQLRPIFEEITAALVDESRAALGFAMHHALEAADAYDARRTVQLDEVMAAFEHASAALLPSPDREQRVQVAATLTAGVATFGASPVEDDLPGVLATELGAPHEEMVRLVAALTTPLGSQPALGALGDTNSLRRRPVIGLDNTRWLWARPGDFIHEALDWAAEACRDHPDLLKSFDKQRQDACEEHIRRTLTTVFGETHVHHGATYPDPGHPDIDVLVAMPGALLTVEAKGGRFTDPARRAAPDRVNKKTREFVDKALEQNARTIAYLDSGKGNLRSRNKRRLVLPDHLPPAVSVIVTLERVDPFATHLPDGGKRRTEPKDGTWLVTLADLGMVADILRHPAEFYAYARTRAAIAKAGGPQVFVEADALAAWLEHRIEPVQPAPDEIVFLDTGSEAVNDYYTYVATSDSPSPARPASGVLAEVLHALDVVHRERPQDWNALAIAALAVQPEDWRPVHKALRAAQPVTAGTRRARKRARRAAAGIRLSPHLTVYVRTSTDETSPPSLGPTTLLLATP
ncbi:hypothetical protein [Streptomyces sp. NPDC048720]|uniref:hypothetical protein n=1 Tax=Streptomyces sp. NPDC048720 TaxID=3365588 RepID=UPI00371534BB